MNFDNIIAFSIIAIILSVSIGVSFVVYEYFQNPYVERCSKMTEFDEKIMLVRHEEAISNLTLRIEKLER